VIPNRKVIPAALWVAGILFSVQLVSAAPPGAPKPPEPRSRSEVENVLAATPKHKKLSLPKAMTIVLLADVKDHGPEAHDYPLWQERWARLLGGSAAWGIGPVNLYGATNASLPKAGATGVKILKAWSWPSQEQFDAADVIVAFCYLNWDAPRIEQVRKYLSRGKGLVVIHAATWTKPEPSAEVGALLGVGGFKKYRHGLVKLQIEKPDHPICLGLPRAIELDDETYWPATPEPTAPDFTVLATSQEQVNPGGAPQPQVIFWTCQPEGGRVFGCVLGHFTWTFDDPFARILLLRGIAWAGGSNPCRFDPLALQDARVK
jgi:type 1 glutamine amidotransferase